MNNLFTHKGKSGNCILFLAFLLFTGLFASPVSAQSLKENDITLKVQGETVENVFNQLSKITNLKFFYDQQVVNDAPRVTLDVKKATLKAVLAEITAQTKLHFNRNNNTIAVSMVAANSDSDASRKITLAGVIVDEKGEAVIGASVAVQGTTLGTITNVDGEYTLADVPDNSKITISFIGYQSMAFLAKDKALTKVVLQEDNEMLDEVVVIGYGTTTVKSATGSISSVKANDLQSYPSTNFASALSGKMAGVQVSLPSGAPGGSPVINVRGIGTLTAGSKPLIVVDGFPLTEGSDV